MSRDEVYEMFVKLGEYFPGKKTDDLFNRTDEEGDGLMSCDEFIKVYMIELEEAQQNRLKIAESYVKF